MDRESRDRMIAEYGSIKTQKEWKEKLQKLLDVSDSAVRSATILIYRSQTDSEMKARSSIDYNGVGFNRVDAMFMSEMAELFINNGRVTPSELYRVRSRIKMNWRQLMKASKANIEKMKAEAESEQPVQMKIPGLEEY